MGSNRINLFIRFLLELTALTAIAFWGRSISENWTKYVYLFVFPLIAAVLWGVFAVPNDPSRSGKAPVKVPGYIRLILELLIFGFAGYAFYDINYHVVCYIFSGIVLLHYVVSYDRIIWLLKQQ